MIYFAKSQNPFSHEQSSEGGAEAEPRSPESNENTEEDWQMGASADGGGEHATLKAELAAATAKLAETQDRMLRIAADFDNSRKRWERERAEVRTYSIQEFARDLLPVIDAFDKAMNAIDQAAINFDTEEGKRMSSIVEGVQMVSKIFQESLKKHGVERVPAKGEIFNPMYHNAVSKTVDASLTQETVADEFVAGYKIGDRVLRTAMVRVASPD